MNMVEKVARAMFDEACPGLGYSDFDKGFYEKIARAAIEALSEPSKEMIDAVMEMDAEDIYKEMMKTALKE